MNYDIPVVCAVCVLKTERAEGKDTRKEEKIYNMFKVIFKKTQ